MPATNHLLSDPNRAGSDSQEFFGKFLERWLWNAQYLADISSHYLTGEPLTLAQAQAAWPTCARRSWRSAPST